MVVQGDTSSALGGALAARASGVALAHVEAGLRSHDLRHPWPEEGFRIAIDRQAALLFAPTELNAANLRREHVHGAVHVTGNSGIDAVLALRRPAASRTRGAALPRIVVTCHRRENWGAGLTSVATALISIASQGLARIEVILHPNPVLADSLQQLIAGLDGIAVRPPCGHYQMVEAMLSCDLVLSDSGGMQEEAAALGVPLLVLRDRTERPEAIACGTIEVVGTCPVRIIEAARRRLSAVRPAGLSLPFGDGHASDRIAAIVGDWLGQRQCLPQGCSAAPKQSRSW